MPQLAWELRPWHSRGTSENSLIFSASSTKPARDLERLMFWSPTQASPNLRPSKVCPRSFSTNSATSLFKGVFFTVQKALPFLRDGASVILVGSADADKQGRVGTSIYTAAKAAV